MKSAGKCRNVTCALYFYVELYVGSRAVGTGKKQVQNAMETGARPDSNLFAYIPWGVPGFLQFVIFS